MDLDPNCKTKENWNKPKDEKAEAPIVKASSATTVNQPAAKTTEAPKEVKPKPARKPRTKKTAAKKKVAAPKKKAATNTEQQEMEME